MSDYFVFLEAYEFNDTTGVYLDDISIFSKINANIQIPANIGFNSSPFTFGDYLFESKGLSALPINSPTGRRMPNPTIALFDGNSGLLKFNDDWINTDRYNQLAQYPTITGGLSGTDSAIIATVTGSGWATVLLSPQITGTGLFQTGIAQLYIKLLTGNNYSYSVYNSPQAAWASYNVSSGMNNKNVISYAVEIGSDLYISGGSFQTGSVTKIPQLTTTGTNIINNYLSYCLRLKSADCKEEELNDKTICYNGVLTGNAPHDFITGVIAKFASETLTQYDVESLDEVTTSIVPTYLNYWSGQLNFNTFTTGDFLRFNLYPYDYTGTYLSYFGTFPPYPTTGIDFKYGVDFTTIDDLVSGINTRLYSGISYPVWYPYQCVSGVGSSGIFVNGPLLFAEKLILPNNDSNYNNIVSFYSARNNSGYSMNLFLQEREVTANPSKTKLKYLLPSYIRLEGSNDYQTWTTLDTKTGINWTGLIPTQITFTGSVNESGINLNLNDFQNPEDEEQITITPNEPSGTFVELYSFNQSINAPIKKGCVPTQQTRTIDIVAPTGWPSGTAFSSCAPSGVELPDKDDNKDNQEGSGISGLINPNFTLSFLRTGWNLNKIGNPTTGTYNYYRVYISGFSGDSNYDVVSPRFFIKNINLFGSTSGILGSHTGKPLCVIGSNYTLDIMGPVPVVLTGLLTGEIKTSDSGIKCYPRQRVLMKISGLESGDYIKFNTESGKLISNSGTGFFEKCYTGTGCFTTGIVDWFYNPISSLITFESGFTSCFNASGQITGQYTRLKPAVVNQQLAAGGFLNGIFNVTIITGTTFTGFLSGESPAYNLTGVYTYTGITGGFAESGYFTLSTGIQISLSFPTQVDYIAGGITGYRNAKSILNYNNPQEFDYISINDKSTSYTTNQDLLSPDYFHSSGDLINTINANQLLFNVTGYIENGIIVLESLYSGSVGNTIVTSAGTSTGSPYFSSNSLTGGLDIYRKIYGTGNYTGYLSFVQLNSGYYYQSTGSGYITGLINSYQGERDFTGVWGLTTGDFFSGYVNFSDSAYLLNPGLVSNTVGGTGFGRFPSVIDTILVYTNLFSDFTTADIAKITITGGNSGIVKYISGLKG